MTQLTAAGPKRHDASQTIYTTSLASSANRLRYIWARLRSTRLHQDQVLWKYTHFGRATSKKDLGTNGPLPAGRVDVLLPFRREPAGEQRCFPSVHATSRAHAEHVTTTAPAARCHYCYESKQSIGIDTRRKGRRAPGGPGYGKRNGRHLAALRPKETYPSPAQASRSVLGFRDGTSAVSGNLT